MLPGIDLRNWLILMCQVRRLCRLQLLLWLMRYIGLFTQPQMLFLNVSNEHQAVFE